MSVKLTSMEYLCPAAVVLVQLSNGLLGTVEYDVMYCVIIPLVLTGSFQATRILLAFRGFH